MAKLSAGLIGTGPWAQRTHAPALATHQEIDFKGVWGRSSEAAQQLAADYGVKAYSGEQGLEELFQASDVIDLAVPPDVQAEVAVRAAHAGRHLLMDKPVATSVAGARKVADAVATAGVSSVVFLTLRFAPETANWISDQAEAGGWFTAQGLTLFPAEGVEGVFAPSSWRTERGALWDIGPHMLSVLIPLLGDVSSVKAVRTDRDLTHLILTHESGSSSSVTLSSEAPAASFANRFEISGEHGTASLPGTGWNDPAGSYHRAIDALVESIRTKRPAECDVRFGLRISEILGQAEQALEEA